MSGVTKVRDHSVCYSPGHSRGVMGCGRNKDNEFGEKITTGNYGLVVMANREGACYVDRQRVPQKVSQDNPSSGVA